MHIKKWKPSNIDDESVGCGEQSALYTYKAVTNAFIGGGGKVVLVFIYGWSSQRISCRVEHKYRNFEMY